MTDLKYIGIYPDHIRIAITDKINPYKSYKFKTLKFSDFTSEQEAIEEAVKLRDELYLAARGVPFIPFKERQTNPSKTSRTGVVGVVPYVSIKKRKGLGYNVCTGFVSVMGTGAKRSTQLFTFKLDQPDSMFNAYKLAVVDAHMMRSMPIPTVPQIEKLFETVDVQWSEIIKDKIMKAQERLKKAA